MNYERCLIILRTIMVLAFIFFPLVAENSFAQINTDRCERERGDRQIIACTEVLKTNPGKIVEERALNLRALAFQRARQYEQALRDMNRLISLNGRVAAYYDNRRGIHADMGRLQEALLDANQAVSLAPNHAFAYHSRAGIRYRMGDITGAYSDYNQAIARAQMIPNQAYRWFDRGTVLVDLARLEEALRDFETVLRLDPNFASARKWLGIALVKLGRLEEARRPLERFLELAPSDDEARNYLNQAILADAQSPHRTVSPQLQLSPNQPVRRLNVNSERVALIIGNTRYQAQAPLQNPKNDADLIANSLRSAGFQQVLVRYDLTQAQMLAAIREFSDIADKADWSVIYYSGHGISFGGTNYMLPVDARLKADRDIDIEAVDVGKIYSAIGGSKSLRLVILDMCRTNPFLRQMTRTISSRSISRGLAPPTESEAGEYTVFAARDGQEALDGEGANSPFADALARRLSMPNVDIRRVFDFVRDDVMQATNRRQQPFTYGSLPPRDFLFVQK